MDGEFIKLECIISCLTCSPELQPPPPSSRPPLLGYSVSFSGAETMQINETNDTYFVVESVSTNFFTFTVAAVNVLGVGKESNLTISSELHYVW